MFYMRIQEEGGHMQTWKKYLNTHWISWLLDLEITSLQNWEKSMFIVWATQFMILMVLNLWWFDLWFFDFMMEKRYAFLINCTLNFEFCYTPGLATDTLYDPFLYLWAVAMACTSQSATQSQVSTANTITTILYNHFVFHFQYGVQ